MLKRLLLLLPLLVVEAGAQEIPEEQAAELRRYTVEMIIFAYAEGVSGGSEIFVPDAPPAEELQPIDELGMQASDSLQSLPQGTAEPVIEETVEEVIDDAVEETVPFELVMLAEEDFSLDEVYAHLDRLDAYEPLLHFGWTQPTYPDRVSEPRPLSSFVTPPDGLQGDLNLYLSRYLHLAVNLQLDAPSTNAAFDENRNEFILDYPVRYRHQ